MDLLDRFLTQVSTLQSVWMPFLVMMGLGIIATWRIMEWRYRGVIEGQDHRIKLRDDTIAHLERAPRPPEPDALAVPPPSEAQEVPAQFALMDFPDDPRKDVVAPEDRIFITNRSVHDLITTLEGKTSVQEEAIARPFIGKWVEISMSVKNVIQRDDDTVVMFTLPDRFLTMIWLHFQGDRDRLEIVEIGDMLSAVGRISELSSTGMRLYGCEMLKAA